MSSEWVTKDELDKQTAPARTWGDTASDTLQKADDFVRAAANSVTFGMADRFAGYMGGQGTDAEVAKSEAARARSPYTSVAGDLAGGVALPGFGAARMAGAMGGGIGARAAAYGLTGAATGAAQGAGNTYTGELPDYIKNAAIGGAFGGTLGAVGGAAFGPRAPRPAAETPTIPDLYQYKTDRYNALNSNPARYDASHLADAANNLETRFATTTDRFARRSAPTAFDALDEMRAPQAAAAAAGPGARATVDPGNLEFIRQGMRDVPFGPDRTASSRVRGALHDFVERPPPGAVVPGYEQAAAIAARQSELAREGNAAFKRAQRVDAMESNAREKTASNYSGLNLENYLRQEYRQLLKINKDTGRSLAQDKGYSPAEIERFQNFVAGRDTPGRNALRWAAKTAGGGSGLGFLGAAGVGGAAGGAYANDADMRYVGMLGLPTLGLLARGAGNRVALNNVRELSEMVRQRSPLFRERLNTTPGTVPGFGYPGAVQSSRDAMTAAIMQQLADKPKRLEIDTSEWK